jgi:ubiquinone biosynthesis protein
LVRHGATLPLRRFKLLLPVIWVRNLLLIKQETQGERIAKALVELGPVFIKLGQMLSTRPDLVGDDIAESLNDLRDNLKPFSYDKAKKIIENELGQSIDDIFSNFEQKPIAAASVAQVHYAVTKDGREVAVKILRPNIRELFYRDLRLLFGVGKFIDKYIPKYKRLRILEVLGILKNYINIELDLRMEAAAASELNENNKQQDVYIPKVYWDLTSKSIYTSEWIDGISIYDINKLKEIGFNCSELAKTLAIMFFDQAFEHGCFHADLHAGNILVNKNCQIVLVDFGIIGRLSKNDRIFVAEIMQGFLQRDYKKVAEIHFKAGYVPENQSLDLFAQSCRAIGEPIIGQPINKISLSKLLALLFKITEDFNMHTQPQLLLLQKTMVLVEGLGFLLDKDANIWELAKPWIEQWAIRNLGIENKMKEAFLNILERIEKLV